jgi:hypothetical protein
MNCEEYRSCCMSFLEKDKTVEFKEEDGEAKEHSKHCLSCASWLAYEMELNLGRRVEPLDKLMWDLYWSDYPEQEEE